MEYQNKYKRWLECVADEELLVELKNMTPETIEDAFYRELSFGTGGLRGTISAGTNRMNIYTVAKASQGVSDYLLGINEKPSVVIGYDSRIKSYDFSRVAASVFAANGITVYIWPELSPVPTVSYAIRVLKASTGVMITASHNPSSYNGYKVYGSDGCQITTVTANSIYKCIEKLDVFDDVKTIAFEDGVRQGLISYIDGYVMDSYIDEVKSQSVLYGDEINKSLSIIYSPLNGTGLKPVTRALLESGFSNIRIVEEQKNPDGRFPTCPYPNPEIKEAMELGIQYCKKNNADLLLATDPDADRCGIAVRMASGDYRLFSGNEVGLLLLDYICSQRQKHCKMPQNPVFIKTIVTMDLAEKIASSYGVDTINVLTGFKFIGEQIGLLEESGRESDYICGFEESFGYLTGTYVRDKDAVNAAYMICEMFAYYKTRGVSLIDKLSEIYKTFGYCLNTLHSYEFKGSKGMTKMSEIMSFFRNGSFQLKSEEIVRIEDYLPGINGLPSADVIKIFTKSGSIVIRPSGTEPKLKVYISVLAEDATSAEIIEKNILASLEAKMI